MITVVILSVIALFALSRNEIAFNVSMKRINVIYEHNMKLIDDSSYPSNRLGYDLNYDYMVLDIRKWTYKQFYPGGGVII